MSDEPKKELKVDLNLLRDNIDKALNHMQEAGVRYMAETFPDDKHTNPMGAICSVLGWCNAIIQQSHKAIEYLSIFNLPAQQARDLLQAIQDSPDMDNLAQRLHEARVLRKLGESGGATTTFPAPPTSLPGAPSGPTEPPK